MPGVVHAQDAGSGAHGGLHRRDPGLGIAPDVGLQDLPGERLGLDGHGCGAGTSLGEGEGEEAVAGADVQQAPAARAASQESIELPDHLGGAEAEPLERLSRLRIDGETQPRPEHDLVRRGPGVQTLMGAMEPEAARIEGL